MIDEELRMIADLQDAKQNEEAFRHAVALARKFPEDVRAQIAAAYASDRNDCEQEAIIHYDLAFKMKIPDQERAGFLLGYGSTLRNVGRTQEAVEILSEANRLFPTDASILAFLALAMYSSGRHTEAIATMLNAALLASRDDGFGQYQRALREYQQELSRDS